MKQTEEIAIRQSPFIFIKYLVVVEFLFAIVPLLAIWFLKAEESYETVTLAETLPYNWLITIVMTSLQVIALLICFVAWYIPSYHLNQREIILKRGSLYQDMSIAEFIDVAELHSLQGLLGKRLNYGDLIFDRISHDDTAKMRNVPNPNGMVTLISAMIEQAVVRPVRISSRPSQEDKSLPDLIQGGENGYVEFKSSLVWDYRKEIANKELYTPVMKNIVAFLNSDGGDVLIGVGDEGEILSIDRDLSTLKKRNSDGFENIFNMAFNKMIGVEFRPYVSVTFPEIDGLIICRLSVSPANQPAYLQYRGDERFYIRAGNASQPLTVSKAADYIRTHFDL